VTYFGAMRSMVKRRQETIVLPAGTASVGLLLQVLSKEYGERFEELTKYSEQTSPLVSIFVNGEPVSNISDSRKLLGKESDIDVSLVNQMSGGLDNS
jgi:molybdopterin converting factor small subunit